MRKAILIVEDQFLIAMDLADALEAAGYAVAGIAATQDGARRVAQDQHVDLATMDVNLAQGDNGVVTAIGLQRDFGIPSLFISGSLDTGVRHAAQAAAPVGFLDKPLDTREILAALDHHFSNYC